MHFPASNLISRSNKSGICEQKCGYCIVVRTFTNNENKDFLLYMRCTNIYISYHPSIQEYLNRWQKPLHWGHSYTFPTVCGCTAPVFVHTQCSVYHPEKWHLDHGQTEHFLVLQELFHIQPVCIPPLRLLCPTNHHRRFPIVFCDRLRRVLDTWFFRPLVAQTLLRKRKKQIFRTFSKKTVVVSKLAIVHHKAFEGWLCWWFGVFIVLL